MAKKHPLFRVFVHFLDLADVDEFFFGTVPNIYSNIYLLSIFHVSSSVICGVIISAITIVPFIALYGAT